MDRKIIEQYAQGAATLSRGIEGLTREDLTSFPVPGTWSIQQIVLHMLDSDLVGSDRMKRIIAMDNPSIMAYDETAFSKKLFYQDLNAETACKMFELNRTMMADILRRLPDDSFDRTGMHSERGKLSLKDFLGTYVHHLAHHMKFLVDKRGLLGKPMK